MSDTVYLVSEGTYSAYHVVHVFSDKDSAAKHVEQWNDLSPSGQRGNDERQVEPREMLSEPPELGVVYYASWSDGNDPDKGVWTYSAFVEKDEYAGRLDRLEPLHFNGPGQAGFYCHSFDPERAVKIVSDARAETLALKSFDQERSQNAAREAGP